ncbi:MAG: sugar phosphate isomerase/epimerase [Verrucomicrobia bacterium]|nr:sugar phosphate isomerase/epimerase [Verrucomicrobiota bacterium]
MNASIDRREFIQTSGLIAAGMAVAFPSGRASAAEAGGRMKKAVGWGMIVEPKLSVEDKFRVAKDAGFEGVEVSRYAAKKGATEPKELTRASEKVGIPIHGVSNGSNPDLKEAIDDAAIYGSDTVLHVVRTDPETPFMENYKRTQELIRSAIPHAEKKRVKICVENVWATFLIEPLTMARYIDEIGSPWVKAYFDVGNVMRWGWPQHWIEVLGKRIEKIHIKEYSLKVAMKEGMGKGFDFPIGQGDINWKRVREELKKIGFQSWATSEVRGGDRKRLAEISAEMDRVLYA